MCNLKISNLLCEYQKHPTGLTIEKPRFSWQLESSQLSVRQKAYQIQVSRYPDFNKICWDSQIVHSEESVHQPYEGPTLKSGRIYYWRVRGWDNTDNQSVWSDYASFQTGLIDPSEWKARWIGAAEDPRHEQPCPLLRRSFTCEKPVRQAVAYITARGLYLGFINGKPVSEDLFTPGWTSYANRLQVQTYNVTACLNQGSNMIGLILGEGWYKGTIGFSNQSCVYGSQTAALVQLEIEYEDGSSETVISDENWQVSQGPILASSLYNGETYDASLEKENWCLASDDDPSGWQPVNCFDFGYRQLIAQENLPVRVIENIQPVDLITTPSGEQIIDMGQNMVGWVSLLLEGDPGQEVKVEHAEILDSRGEFYTANLRKAKQTNHYLLNGKTGRWYHPHFSWQGFRYVRITGWPGDMTLDTIKDRVKGQVIHTDMPLTGDFSCSDSLINQLQHNIRWGQKGNFLDVPTDCPQRDERLGWTGDAQMFVRTACFNYDTALFFTKWLRDLKAEQSLELGVPFVVPNVLPGDEKQQPYSSAAWGDAATICPWTVYQCYGDRRLLEEQFDSMKMWVDYIQQQGEDSYLWNTGFHFGDWLGLDAKEDSYFGATATDLIATAFYVWSTKLVWQAAAVLGRHDDELEYQQLYQKVKAAFRNEFITPSGRVAVPTQTAHVLVLMFNLASSRHTRRIAEDLAVMIEKNDKQLTTGFVGTPYLCTVLSQHGYHDLACELVLREDYPSWLYQVKKGATTVWEHWDGIKPDGSMWSDDMNSFNHYAYGAIGDWLYRVVCGLDTDPDLPGYKHSLIAPRPIPGMAFAQASLMTLYGNLSSRWETREDGRYAYTFEIPVNTSATVKINLTASEKTDPAAITINGQLIAGLCALQPDEAALFAADWQIADQQLSLELGSGRYVITA